MIRQAESNTLEISRNIRTIVDDLAGTLPEGVSIFITGDDAVFINGSIHEVLRTLALVGAHRGGDHLSLPARPARHAHPGDDHPGRADRHARRDLCRSASPSTS